MKKALVLSGGGARCIAQLGFIEVLYENGIFFDIFSGSSGGAIIAAFLAKGYRPKEIFEILKDIDFKKFIKFNFFKRSIFSFKNADKLLDSFNLDDFSNLEKKLYICVTDYDTYETLYIDGGKLSHFLLASSSLIPIFEPYNIDGKYYIDGGFTDNLPTAPCLDADFICAINVNPPIKVKNSFFGNFYKAGYIMLNNNIKYSKQKAHKYLEFKECGNFSIFDMKNFDKIYDIGLKEGKKEIDYFKRLYND
ncbi:patatin-like phospholipase family protein [Nitrosophilus kaiyonis]|uniref:patatin-like phospholipase family protein n=1 Tax=Nitrosophilus kaiyonis TaxID=2930200 RepID=UPI00249370C6|nr:patatin-like phospholipase family protein [Nitrosophilus kaiyonis]